MANKFACSLIAIALSASCLTSVASFAQAEEAAPAAAPQQQVCLQNPAGAADAKAFLNDPKALHASNQVGGLPLTNTVRALAGSDKEAMAKIMELAKDANSEQKSAIAAGLARVVFECGKLGTEDAANYGSLIQTQVAGLGDATFTNAFLQPSNDIRTAAVGPGAAGVSVGGGQTDASTGDLGGDNTYKASGDGPFDTTSASYTIGDATFVDDSNSASPSGSAN